ncbi:hypothetical protein D9M68_948480 [compost metagenome]
MLEFFRAQPILRVDQFEFLPVSNDQRCPGLRADAQPIDAWGGSNRAVGFDRHAKASSAQGRRQFGINLKQWLSTRQHYKAAQTLAGWPLAFDGICQRFSVWVLTATGTVGTNKIGVTEFAGGGCSINLSTTP